jgi:serine protease Do
MAATRTRCIALFLLLLLLALSLPGREVRGAPPDSAAPAALSQKAPARTQGAPPPARGGATAAPRAGRPLPIRSSAGRSPYCQGAYANDPLALAPEARRVEERTRYTFCVRSIAVYQCAYYGPDGSLMSRRLTKTAHGTAFAFRRDATQTYFLTNEHVTEWPFVTAKGGEVEGVPLGCKRTSQTVSIVDDENDSYGKDDIGLQRVVVDAELDTAILKAPVKVAVTPFGLGQSAGLKVGDAVQVRGFPLAAFQAVNAGKVISARERDQEGKWDHWDFVVDAQLSSGNSGSPVLAISCKTHRFELVGIYHAGYRLGQSLNVVIGIDELRDLMTTFRPSARRSAPVAGLTPGDRSALLTQVRQGKTTPLIPFGGSVVGIRLAGTRLLYDFYPRRFPLVDWRVAVFEDLPSQGFGRVGRTWFGNERGLHEKAFSELKPGEQNTVAQLVDAVRLQAQHVLQFRELEPLAKRTRSHYERLRHVEREVGRGQAARVAAMRALLDMVGLYAPGPNAQGLPISVTTALPASPSPAPAVVPVRPSSAAGGEGVDKKVETPGSQHPGAGKR